MRTTTVYTSSARESAWDFDGNAVEYTLGGEWEPHPSDDEEDAILGDEPAHKTGVGWPDWAENGSLRRSADGTVYAACCRTVDTRDLGKVADEAKALLDRLDNITTDDFAMGEEREEREALRAALEAVGIK